MGSPTPAVSWIGSIQLRQGKMSRLLQSTSFVVVVAVTLVLLVISTSAEPKPGHMQHQYYKEQERQRQRASRKAEWGEYAHQHSGAAVVEHHGVLMGLLVCWRTMLTTTWYERDGVVRTMMCSSCAHAVISCSSSVQGYGDIYIEELSARPRCDHSYQ